jgi:hypothetical protein
MLTQAHEAALVDTAQFKLGMDLLTRLENVRSFAERIEILERAEEEFDQLDVREHAIRVADAAASLASHCGFPSEYANRLRNATRLHDVGKLFMPMAILGKEGRPTEFEFELIKEHARHGGELLGRHAPAFVANVARYHHERYDGRGYNGLAGEDIPVEARLVQIADVHDALRSRRAYKAGMSEAETLEKMVAIQGERGGVAFDPHFLRRFVEMRLAEDHGIPADAAARLSAFVKSDPMTEISAAVDREAFEGWEVDKRGTRRKYFVDPETDYRKLAEMRDAFGEVKYRLPLPGNDPAAAIEAARDRSPRTPRL